MVRRFELSNEDWSCVMALVAKAQKTGRPRNDDRLMLNGIFWILCSGAAWRDLPNRFGPWSTVYQRYHDWRNDGTLELVLNRLQIQLNDEGMVNLETRVPDFTGSR